MSWRENESLFCLECDEPLPEGSVALSAPHPFIPDREVEGCPRCREVTDLTITCQWAGCTRIGTGGTSTPDGYRWTCWDHRPGTPERGEGLQRRRTHRRGDRHLTIGGRGEPLMTVWDAVVCGAANTLIRLCSKNHRRNLNEITARGMAAYLHERGEPAEVIGWDYRGFTIKRAVRSTNQERKKSKP